MLRRTLLAMTAAAALTASCTDSEDTSSATPPPTVAATSTTSTTTTVVTGEVVVQKGPGEEAVGCTPADDSPIVIGSLITIRDSSGADVGTSNVGEDEYGSSGKDLNDDLVDDACALSFEIQGVPTGRAPYSLSVGGFDSEPITESDLEGEISFTIGTPKPVASPTPAAGTIPGDGTFLVPSEVKPGTYRTPGGDGCYWARLSGTSGELGDVIANDNVTGPTVVTIRATDKAFETNRCGTWTRV